METTARYNREPGVVVSIGKTFLDLSFKITPVNRIEHEL